MATHSGVLAWRIPGTGEPGGLPSMGSQRVGHDWVTELNWTISNPKRWCCGSAALNRPANLENSTAATGLEKFSFIPIPKKGNAKECSNYRTVALISHASKVMLKILQARLQQYVKREHPDVQAGFRRGRGTRDQIANICWSIENPENTRKASISALLTNPKFLTV